MSLSSFFTFTGMIGLGLISAGCTTPTPTPELPIAPAHPRPVAPVAALPAPTPEGPFSLARALELTVARSPELQAWSWELRRAGAVARQAPRWANPELEFELENFGGDGTRAGTGAAESTLSLAQTLPLGGDAGRARALADLRTEGIQWDYEAARLELLAETARRFIRTLAAVEHLTLAEDERTLALEIERITDARVEAGDASPVEQARVRVPVVAAELNQRRAERELEAAQRRLLLCWQGDPAAPVELRGDLHDLPALPAAAALVERINQSPAVARWATEVSSRVAERRLAEAQAIPDLTARLGLRRDNASEEQALVVGLSLPLPLFDRQQDHRLAARHGEAAARQRQRAAEQRVESQLSAFYASAASALDEATALRDRALPAARAALDATQQAFREGKLPFLEVLDAQRTLFDLERRYLDALELSHDGLIALEALLGQPLHNLNP